MAFDRYIEIDKSDIALWAMQPACHEFALEIQEYRDLAFRELLSSGKENHDMYAEKYKAYGKILSLIEEARKLK